MSYSETLLKQIRALDSALGRYPESASAEESARRDALLQALAWYVHKLQVRLLPRSRAAGITPTRWDEGAPYRAGS